MEAKRVFRNINAVDKFFGLELADGCVLLLTFFTAFSFNREGLFSNGMVLLLVYVGLRAVKRGKPEGYLFALFRYMTTSRFKKAPEFEELEALEPLNL